MSATLLPVTASLTGVTAEFSCGIRNENRVPPTYLEATPILKPLPSMAWRNIMSHASRMMNMRFKAMQRNLQAGYKEDTFRMFDVSNMWASDYYPLPGY